MHRETRSVQPCSMTPSLLKLSELTKHVLEVLGVKRPCEQRPVVSGRVEHVRRLGVVDAICNGAVDPPCPHLDADSVVLPHGSEVRWTADGPTPFWDETPLPIVLSGGP